MKCRLSEDWLSTYTKGVEEQIVGIVQLLHGGDLRKLSKCCLSQLTSAGKEGYDGARRTVEKPIWKGFRGKGGRSKMIHTDLNIIC